MPRVSAAFFLTGGLFVLAGMIWGMTMGISQNFQTAPAHAHLNLLGWVTMGLYGTFYAFTAKSGSNRLAWSNYIASALGVIIMIPSLGMMLGTGNAAYMPGVAVGSVLNLVGLLMFLVSAIREVSRSRAASTAAGTAEMRLAA